MNYYTIAALVLLAIGLSVNYKRDKGAHRKAKFVHAICLALFCLRYASSVGLSVSLLNNFEQLKSMYSRPVGFIPGEIHFILFLSEWFLSLVALFMVAKMIGRDPWALKWFLRLLPFLFVTTVLDFYKLWTIAAAVSEVGFQVMIGVGFLFLGGLMIAMFFIYRNHFMKEFFGLEAKAEAMQEADVLDTDI